jgi:hypothetical protein
VPELELGQTADKRTELVVLLDGKARASLAILKPFILGQRRVEFGLEKGEEQVEQVDSEGVGNCFC